MKEASTRGFLFSPPFPGVECRYEDDPWVGRVAKNPPKQNPVALTGRLAVSLVNLSDVMNDSTRGHATAARFLTPKSPNP